MQRILAASGTVELYCAPALAEVLAAAGALEPQPPSALLGSAASSYRGRGRPVLLRLPGQPALVVKSLRHGGLLAGLMGAWFVGAGRLRRTLALVEHLRAHGVETPAAAFGRVHRHPLLRLACRLELATEQVAGSIDLLEYLRRPAPAELAELARALGALIRRMHDAGVWHADLNLKNVLVQAGTPPRPHLIDWETSRCGARVGEGAAVANLCRLLRSCHKRGVVGAPVRPRHLLLFLRGYEADPVRRRRLLRRARRRLHWSLPLHRLTWRAPAD